MASLLGVHYQTVYRWVRDGRLEAVRVGVAYEVADAEVARVSSLRAAPVAPPAHVRVRNWEHRRDRLLIALLAGDEVHARSIVEPLAAGGVPLVDVCERLISPCLAEIGARWQRGSVSVAEEHRATATCERLVARIAVHPRGRPRGAAIVTSAPGDEHVLPSAMAALVLRADHWQVHHLGGNLPGDEVERLALDVRPDVIVISQVNTQRATAGEALRTRLCALGFRVLLGGPGAALSGLVEQARTHGDASYLQAV